MNETVDWRGMERRMKDAVRDLTDAIKAERDALKKLKTVSRPEPKAKAPSQEGS